MRGGLFVLLVLLGILSSSAVLAETGINLNIVDNSITISEVASYDLKITNNGVSSQTYTLYGLEVLWSIDPEFRAFVLHPGQSKQVNVKVKPLGLFKPSSYSLKLFVDVTSSGGKAKIERLEQNLNLVLYPEVAVDYLPAIKVEVDMLEKIDPKEAVSIKLFLENGNPLDLSDLTVRIQSDLPEFKKEVNLDLSPLGKKTTEFTVTPNPFTQPKKYVLFFVFERGNEQVKVVEKKIEVIELIPAFSVDVGEESVFLKKFWRVNIKNDGNVLNTQVARYPISWLGSVLTSGDVDFKTFEGQRYATWELALKPGESQIVSLVTNYRLLIYLLVVLLVLIGIYVYVQSPVSVEKKAVTTKTDDGGALSEIKVTLEVKNKGNKVLKDIDVTDIIPGIANLEKSIELGTLKPHQIRHTNKGTKVIWSLAEVEPKEHRLITYKVKAKLNILGTISLPRAVIEYKKNKKKKGKAYSNVFKLG